MQRSENRILTTHAGSLPRPATLTTLFARRVRGEAIDPGAIEAEGRMALRSIVKKQIATGLDVIDDGEQSRESFVLYLRHRLSDYSYDQHVAGAAWFFLRGVDSGQGAWTWKPPLALVQALEQELLASPSIPSSTSKAMP